jgi:CheY-like chemotaxis protein
MASVNNDPVSKQPKILLVDDREDNLLSIEAILQPDGYLFYRAYSGNQALKILLSEFDFAMILMDVKMPVLNGFETATLIYERERLRHIPIIFITANNYGDENVFKGYQAGGIDYIFKPINPEVLRAKVAVFIDFYKKKALLSEQEQKLSVINKQLETGLRALKDSEEKVRQRNAKLQQEISNLESILASSKLSVDQSTFVQSDMNVLVRGLLADMEDQIKDKMAMVSIEPLPSLRVSPQLMRPLFQNLIRNALRNSKNDVKPIINIHSEIGPDSYGDENHNSKARNNLTHCRIFVEDNGMGFDQKNADKIFGLGERQLTNGELRDNRGLVLCRKIMEEHNGSISATGKINGGSTFIISLPMPQ